MSVSDQLAYLYAHQVEHGAKAVRQRTGQYLFNHLPEGACRVVAGTVWDPFHYNLCRQDLEKWFAEHLIFSDDGSIIGVFNNDQILWEKEN